MINHTPSIGDTLWVIDFDQFVITETCPDCLGTRTWHVTLPNGEQYDFGCARCSRGYEGSVGYVEERYNRRLEAKPITVTRVEVRPDGVEVNHRKAEHVYSTREDAEAAIPARLAEMQRGEDEQVQRNARNAARRKPRRPYPEGQHDHDGAVASELHSIKYAKQQIQRARKEIQQWIEYAARKGTVLRENTP